jgi:ectoine hydroxylase-related dioxygenase (phytanoyl-CoA dioxygenase family)
VTEEPTRLFQSDGYYVAPGMFDDEEVARIERHFDDVIAGRYETGRAPHGIDFFGSGPSMIKVSNAWWADRVLATVVKDFEIAAIAAALLGVDELYLWSDSLYWKAPAPTDWQLARDRAAHERATIGWHQDKEYWPTSSSEDMITACVALYPAGPETGGMRFVPGSNRWGLVGGSKAVTGEGNAAAHVVPAIPEGETWQEVCPVLRPGDVTFHHCLTFHGSGPNLRPSPRRSITIHMVSGAARVAQKFDDPGLAFLEVGEPFRGDFFPRLYP